jgi:hypothetical protein
MKAKVPKIRACPQVVFFVLTVLTGMSNVKCLFGLHFCVQFNKRIF